MSEYALISLGKAKDEIVRLRTEVQIATDEWVAARDEIRRLRTVNAALLEALELMVLRVPSVLSWCDGGSSPYANDDISDCHDAVDVGRAAIALAKVKP